MPAILQRPLAYQHALQKRDPATIDLVVIHCTELPDLDTARVFGERISYPLSGSGNSGHFYLDRDGSIEQWVETERIAHHVRGFNERSIGIELVNRGRYPDWLHTRQQKMDEIYPEQQINRLIDLLGWLCSTIHSLHWIAGHEDLDTQWVPASDNPALTVKRKLDPGPLFPWHLLVPALPLTRMLCQPSSTLDARN